MWNKIKDNLRRFMIGRNGSDELSMAVILTAVVIMLLSSIFGSALLNLLSMALYVYCIFRMFSKNIYKRRAENQAFLAMTAKSRTAAAQWFIRVKNIRQYKYFKCPQCGSRLRLPRKVGEVTVTCGKCKNKFKKKA